MSDTAQATEDEGASVEELETAVAVLREENQRLRAEHRRLLQAKYRRSAQGLGVIALIAIGGATVVPAIRTLLLTVAAIAAFGGLLTYYLTPERFVAATVGESVYDAVAQTGEDLVDELGLHYDQIYLPTDTGRIRVYIPQHRDYTIPDRDEVGGLFVVSDTDENRGVALTPTGRDLVAELEATITGELTAASAPDQLAEALVEQFELADTATIDSQEPGRVTFAVAGSAYGDVERFDHPIASVLATGLATTLDRPVELETTTSENARVDSLITCRWEPDEHEDTPTDSDTEA